MIQLEKIAKTHMLGKVKIEALKEINLNIQPGEFVTIVGPSGSGKSTLLNIIGLVEIPTLGKLVLNNEIVRFKDKLLSKLRRYFMGYIFQNFNLIPVFNTYENIEYPLLRFKLSKSERQSRIMQCLKEVGLENYAKRYPKQLSGGQQQRVAIARALVKKPKLILADEPTANLDSKTKGNIIDILHEMNQKHGVSIIMATHDTDHISQSDNLIRLNDGRLVH